MAQKPTDAHSVTSTLPFGFFPFFSLPKSMLRESNSRSNASFTSALSTAEHDLPVQTKTCRRIGAVVTGARVSSVFWSVIKPLSLIGTFRFLFEEMVTHQAQAISLY